MKKIVAAVIAASALAAHAGPSDSLSSTTDAKKVAWMHKGIEVTKAKLKDPSSAEFRNVYFHRGQSGTPMTCGEVNSKNSYGGYAGFQRFISAGSSELTFLESQVAGGGFSQVWSQFCE